MNEDLTKVKLLVFMCVKKKMMDEMKDAYISKMVIKYRDHMEQIHTVKHEEYEEYLDLPRPYRIQKDKRVYSFF